MHKIFGVDFGGVINDKAYDDTDVSFFGPRFLETPAVDGAFDALNALNRRFDSVYIVSTCMEKTEKKTREWMQHNSFYSKTGIPAENVYFTRERQHKAEVCKRLGITHFIDDRLEILGYLTGIVEHLYLFKPKAKEVEQHKQYLKKVVVVESWEKLLQKMN